MTYVSLDVGGVKLSKSENLFKSLNTYMKNTANFMFCKTTDELMGHTAHLSNEQADSNFHHTS